MTEAQNEKRSLTVPFPGFYESWLSEGLDYEEAQQAEYMAEEDSAAACGLDCYEIQEAIFHVAAYRKAHDYLVRDYLATFEHVLNDAVGDLPRFAFEFDEMVSPREYNFTTDRLFAKLSLADVERMRDCVSQGTLADTIRDRHTSYDGFYSYYSNDFAEWDAKPISEWDANELGTLLVAFMADNAPDVEKEVMDNMLDNGEVFVQALDAAVDWAKLETELKAKAQEAQPTSGT